MKLLIYGAKAEEVTGLAEKIGFELVDTDPDIIASYGGDGTIMHAEYDFPGIPKFILKNSKTCKKGIDLPPEELLKKIFDKEYIIEESHKLEAVLGNERIMGFNEIIVHNADPRSALRYEIFVDKRQIGNVIIGDGIVVATPYGSTGYFRSITDSFTEIGIGVAFNNSTEQLDHMVLREDAVITVKIMRGPGVAYADNQEKEIFLKVGDILIIKEAKDVARIIKLKE